jgi:TonB family protein
MRSILAAAVLFVAPVVMPAQALHANVSHLVASVDAPAFAFQASAVNAAAPRIYTGLIAPVRMNALKLAASPTAVSGQVTVEYTVDTAGVPQDVHVVKALDANTDERVVTAVRQIRYTPGTLNGTAVAVPVTLHVAINQ